MKEHIGPCPHCGTADDVYINIRAYGWAVEYFTTDGVYESLSIDNVKYTDSATIRCASCQRVRCDLELVAGTHHKCVRKKPCSKPPVT